MEFKRQGLVAESFQGFLKIQDLRNGKIRDVPKGGGAYVVLRETDAVPTFLENNPGGRFKGKNPTVSKHELHAQWVTGAYVIYVGKGDELQRRMRQFIDFGAGKPVGHWGGRLVWQIENSEQFVIAWKHTNPRESAADLESKLLHQFHDIYGQLPFANLRF